MHKSETILRLLQGIEGLNFFPHFLEFSENTIVYSYDFSLMLLGIATLKKIYEIVVDEGGQGNV